MRAEFNRIRSEMEFENSLKFGKKALCGVVSVIEWCNQKYQPFDLQLEGWSESVMTGIDSYEGVLERLVTKYRHRINTPPEIELALSLAASGLMYHMTNTMFKQAMLKGGNPDLIKSMVGAFGGPRAPAPAPAPPPPQQPTPQRQSYQMKGPGIDLGSMMQHMPSPMPYPQPANPPSAHHMHPPAPSPLQPPPRPPAAAPSNHHHQQASPSPPPPAFDSYTTTVTLLEDDQDDRLSDVISEDMRSVVSADLESVAGSLTHEADIKTVQLDYGGRRPGNATATAAASARKTRLLMGKKKAAAAGSSSKANKGATARAETTVDI
jgi:hypothetical protein